MDKKLYALAEVKDAGGDDPNGSFDVILSTPTLDRDGEVVDAKIFEPLPDHITFDIDHGMSTATTVASGVPEYDGDDLRVKGTYSSIPRAQEVRTLVKEGHIRTVSVAMMGAVREVKDGVPHVTKAELLNGSFVPIPANREALVLSAKALAEKAGTPAPVVRKGHGMTANDLREALQAVVREAHGAEDTWAWVRDYTDEWVVYELDADDEYACYQQAYTVTDSVVTLTGDSAEVTIHTTYEPKSARQEPTTEAPVTPAAEAGKSPASEVVELARLRGELALLSV